MSNYIPIHNNILVTPNHLNRPVDVNSVLFDDSLYIGSFQIYDTNWIYNNKITHIIDLSGAKNPHLPKFKYIQILIDDLPSADISQYFKVTIPFIEEGR